MAQAETLLPVTSQTGPWTCWNTAQDLFPGGQ